MARPNVLFIQTDQQFTRSLGCYGSTICRTPHIDALAAEGRVFTNAYAACPICTPARASLQTGLYPFKHGMQTNIYNRGCQVHELPDHPTLLSRRLQQLGYSIGFTGKWHLGFGSDADAEAHHEYRHHVKVTPGLGRVARTGSLPSTLGYEGEDFPGHGGIGITTPQFEAYLARKGLTLKTRKIFDYYPDTFEVLSGTETTVSYFLTEQAIGLIEDFVGRGRPFYYQLNFWGPHSPYHASSEYLDLYRDTPIPPWPSFFEDQTTKPRIHNAHRTETTAQWTWKEYETALRVYYASVTEIDAQVGRLVEALKRLGQYDNTVIVFSSDHGDSLGVHRGLTDKALFMYEETNRIPLIIKEAGRPDRKPGTKEDRFAGTCDIYSTILDYAGLPLAEAELDGRSLRPLLEGREVKWRDCMVTECSGLDYLLVTQRALRYQNFKYVFNAGDLDELYDLAHDPHELINLAACPTHQERLKEMRMKLASWMDEMGDGLRERFLRLHRLF